MVTPLASTFEQNQLKNLLSRQTNNKIKILILEPDPKVLDIICSILKHKYDIYRATTIADTINFLRCHKITIIITDQALPNDKMRGHELLAQTKQQYPDVVRILLVSHLDAINIKSYLKTGDTFKILKKPINQNELVASINEAIEFYLEISGSLAEAIKNFNSPTTQAQITSNDAPFIHAASPNIVVIKCSDEILFNSIKNAYKEIKNTLLLHATNHHTVIKYLESEPVRSLVFAFEQKAENYDSDANFLCVLKQELPHLGIIGLVYKDTVSYKVLIELMSNKKITNYLPLPNKMERIRQQLDMAIDESKQRYPKMTTLVWSPKTSTKEMEQTVPHNFLSRISSITHRGIQNIKYRLKRITNIIKKILNRF